jgi:hypothetical protein
LSTNVYFNFAVPSFNFSRAKRGRKSSVFLVSNQLIGCE